MHVFCRPARFLGAVLLSAILTFGVSTARADDPPPQDPTLSTGGSGSGNAVIADEETWIAVVDLILSIEPYADYETVVYYALVWFNLLPPDTVPSNDPPPEDPPPSDPPPSVATPEQWAEASAYVLDNFFPGLDAVSLAAIILDWFNLLPPE